MKAGGIFHVTSVESAFLRKWPGITTFVYIQENVHFIVKFVEKTSKQNLQFTFTRNFTPKLMQHLVPHVRNSSELNPVSLFTLDPIQGRDHTPVTFVIKDSLRIETCWSTE
jgi:hypothetical protein